MTADSVWISDVPRDELIVEIKFDFDEDRAARKAIQSGGDPLPEGLPITGCKKYPDSSIENQSQLFRSTEVFEISGELAAPLLEFDLGAHTCSASGYMQARREDRSIRGEGIPFILQNETFGVLVLEAHRLLCADKSSTLPLQ